MPRGIPGAALLVAQRLELSRQFRQSLRPGSGRSNSPKLGYFINFGFSIFRSDGRPMPCYL